MRHVLPLLDTRPARRVGRPVPDRVRRTALVCAAVALVVRLVLLASPFGAYDGDAAVNALMAQDLLHGRHLWLVWAGQAYAGTLDVALQAVSIRLFGVGQVAVGLPFAVVGAATVGLLAWTTGRCLRSSGAALAVGLAVSAYPLWLLIWGTAIGGGGYTVSSLLAFSAISLALLRRRPDVRAVAGVGLLSGIALWSQPLAASQVAVAGIVVLSRAGGVRRALALLPVLLATALPGLAIWYVGLHDGRQHSGGPLTDAVTLHTVFDPALLKARTQALYGIIGDKALGLVAGTGPDVAPPWLARAVVAAVAVGVVVALAACLLRRSGPLVPALLGALVLSAVFFVLFPLSLDTASPAVNAGVPRPLGVPRYLFPGMYALAALAGLSVWALVRAPDLLRRGAGGVLAAALLCSSAVSAHVLLEPGAYTRTRPSTPQLQAFATALERDDVRCVVAGYWDVYPLVLASDDRLRGESTFVNRLEVQCGDGPGVARLFVRPGGVVGPDETAYAASRPGARAVPGPGLVAYLS